MRRPIAHRVRSTRSGLSLVEVIVITLALLLLLSLILPAVNGPRSINRKLECFYNIKQLALAATSYATAHHGQLPPLTSPAPGLASDIKTSWVVQLLPHLDQGGAIEYIEQMKTPKEARDALQMVLGNTYKSLQCPEDWAHFRQPGSLNYGANIGYGAWRGTPQGITTSYDFAATDHSAGAVDWNNNGKLDATDKEVARATGLFWNADADEFRMTFDDIFNSDGFNGDGSGSTILFAESTHLTPIHQAGPQKNGENPGALDVGIGLGYQALGLKKQKEPNLFLDRAAKPTTEYSQYFAPNSPCSTTKGIWPTASSMHKGGVNVAFADGHSGFISNDINWAVWASLHSPQGVRLKQAKISDADY